GLEFAVVEILAMLRSEGARAYSLGATYGPAVEESPNADPGVVALFDTFRARDDFGQGNFQFKNKFRPETSCLYLCRPPGLAADLAFDVPMMIAEPPNYVPRTPVSPPAARAVAAAVGPISQPTPSLDELLEAGGWNPVALPPDRVPIDLMTDSWAELDNPFLRERVRALEDLPGPAPELSAALRRVFPFQYVIPVSSGRQAEAYLAQALRGALPRSRRVVVQNGLFPTWIFHQVDRGFEPLELVPSFVLDPEVLEPRSSPLYGSQPFGGDLDLEALRRRLEEGAGEVAFVLIELAGNAAGGLPVSRQHLEAVAGLLKPQGIPLVLDATRVLENALLVEERDPGAAGDLWRTAGELLSPADILTASLTKDFGVNVGGLIGLNDTKLYQRLKDAVSTGGSGLNPRDHRILARAVSDRETVEELVRKRVEQVERLWRGLRLAGLPVAGAPGTHCVLLDSGRLPVLAGLEHPVPSLLAHLFRHAGIRAGAHSAGLAKNRGLNRMVRLAVPLGFSDTQLAEVIERLPALLDGRLPVEPLRLVDRPPGFFGESKAVYAPASGAVLQIPLDPPFPKGDAPAWPSGTLPVASGREAPAPTTATLLSDPDLEPLSLATDAGWISPSRPGASAAAGASSPPLEKGGQGGFSSAAVLHRDPHSLPSDEPIAIVGLAGRYPQADSLNRFWENLAVGMDCIREIPQDRWDYRQRARLGKPELKWGGFIDGVDTFDSLFFNIAPREALLMDPQERLFLEVAWEALEDGGLLPETLVPEGEERNVGVFVGAVWTFYQTIGAEEAFKGNVVGPNSYLWAVANRVSYYLNLSGPSLAIDTACSSSLTALHMACEALRKGECRAAIAGGVNLDLHPSKRVVTSAGGFLSPDGRCYAFSNKANGYVAGEGVGAVILKPLSAAERDGDLIHGVIRGTAVNHGGKASGFTVPGPKAQQALIRTALDRAGVDPRTVSYVEAHGTGTKLGDPIEIQGLTEAFRESTQETGFCAIGSVKSNIGHLEAAAGVAGLTKVLLQLRHGKLAPSTHTEELNEFIDFEVTPFVVQRRAAPWHRPIVAGREVPRRAGLSSFGAGGANAHVVLEEYRDRRPSAAAVGAEVFVLSARAEDNLKAYAARLAEALDNGWLDSCSLRDVSYTLQLGRRSLDHRLAVVASSREELSKSLGRFLEGTRPTEPGTASPQGSAFYLGHVKNAGTFAAMLDGEDRRAVLEILVRGGDPHKLARLWCDGVLGDWQGVREEGTGRRVSLPTYPFTRQRHWIGTADPVQVESAVKPLHTFIDENVSTFGRQAYRKVFDPEHFVFRDHVVGGEPTMPGVGYLEMARAAGELACGSKVGRIKNIVWSKPIALEACGEDIFVELTPAGDHLLFEMCGAGAKGERDTYARGKMFLDDPAQDPHWAQPLDLAALRTRLPQRREQAWCYEFMRSGGIVHRETYQSIQELWHGEEESLSRLRFPKELLGGFGDLVLHPSMMDGATQTTLGLWKERGIPYVPFVMGEVHIIRPVPEDAWAYVRLVGKAGDSRKYHITVTDASGLPSVHIHDFSMMPFVRHAPDVVYFEPRWQQVALEAPAVAALVERSRSILVFDTGEAFVRALEVIPGPAPGPAPTTEVVVNGS
ncbi:MAG: polyketide synthase dehydratase domain-containing protein, partial [Acidobacteria bacterium]|nr:polyketide synthase dehydratase domain-containing protein [Acidobacteriota bacterium]